MDKIPVLWNRDPVGEMTLEKEALYTCFSVRCRIPEDGLWYAWVIGERGKQRLGILEPDRDCLVIQRRCSNQSFAHLGKLLHGAVETASCKETSWERVTEPDRQIRDPWLRKQVKGMREVWVCSDAAHVYLALPYDKGRPFSIPALFCFAKIRMMFGRPFALFAFDETNRPVFV